MRPTRALGALGAAVLVGLLGPACTSFEESRAVADARPLADAAREAFVDGGRGDGDAPEDVGPAVGRDAHADVATPPPLLWSAEVSGVFGEDLNAIWGSGPGDVYAVGGLGTIVHRTGDGSWTKQTAQFGIGDVYGIWGTGPTNVDAVTVAGYVCHSEGTGTWACATVAEALTGVWGPSTPDAGYYYVVSEVGAITRVTGPNGQTTEEDSGGALGFFGIWGSSPADVYAASDHGEIFHSVGDGTWTVESGGQAGFGGTMWGSSSMDVYAAGGTVLYHSTGDGTWTSEATGTDVMLSGVWGSSATDVYLVGDQGTVLHGTGDGVWPSEATGSSSNLYAVWGSSSGDVYAVGSGGAILHRVSSPP